jgi:hypothetical protein
MQQAISSDVLLRHTNERVIDRRSALECATAAHAGAVLAARGPPAPFAAACGRVVAARGQPADVIARGA